MKKDRDEGTNKTRVYAPFTDGEEERTAGSRRAKPFNRRQDTGASYDWVYQDQPEKPLFIDLSDELSDEPSEEDAKEKPKKKRGLKKEKVNKKKNKPKKKNGKKQEKQPRNWKNVIGWIMAAVVALGIMAGLYFVFLLDTVKVEGNEQYADASIIELSGLHFGTHMLLCNLDAAKENIQQNPYLKVVSIERSLPRTVVITVQERKETAAIRSMDYDVIIDSEGHVLSIGSGSDLSGLLNVYGISVTGFQVGKPIGDSTDFRTNALLTIFDSLQASELMEEVSEIDLSNTMRVTFRTPGGVTVLIGQPEGLEDKLGWMRDGLASLKRSGVSGGTLDVSARGGAIYSPEQHASQNTDTQEPPPEDTDPAEPPPEDGDPDDGAPADTPEPEDQPTPSPDDV